MAPFGTGGSEVSVTSCYDMLAGEQTSNGLFSGQRRWWMTAVGRSVRGQHVLVTGGAGFIGSHLVDALLAEGAGRVTVVDNFYLGKHGNLAAAQQHAPDLAILPLDASDYTALRATFEQLPAVDT